MGGSEARGLVTVTAVRGDANGAGFISAIDIFYLINEFRGPNSIPPCRSDANSDGIVTVDDVDRLAAFLFGNGPAPL